MFKSYFLFWAPKKRFPVLLIGLFCLVGVKVTKNNSQQKVCSVTIEKYIIIKDIENL